MERKVQIIIPMSGMGKRFVNAGYKNPKPLIEVDGYPIIYHVINLFPDEKDFTFIINKIHDKETNVKEILQKICNEKNIDCKIHVIDENKKGPVFGVYQIKDYINDDNEVIVSYCDYGTDWNYKKFIEENRHKDVDGSIPCYKGFHPHMLGADNYAFVREKDNYMIEIQEKKPFTDNKMNEYASNGTYYFKTGKILKKYFKELMDLDINTNGEYYISMVNNLLVRDGLKVNIFEIDKMLQWGTPYDLEIYKSWSNYFSNIIKEQESVSNPKGTTTILPMSGRGNRFVKEGYNVPKPFIDVNGYPMYLQAIKCLPKSDNNIFICLNEHKKFISEKNLNTEYIYIDGVTEGQACTTNIGLEKLDADKPIMITACDNGVYYNHDKYQKMLNDENIDVIVWSFRNNQTSKVNQNMYSWMNVDENDNIKYVSCKKFIYDDPLKTHAIIGGMFFRKAKFFIDGFNQNVKLNIRTNNEFYVDDVINQNIKYGLNVKVFEVDNYICWGTPDDYKTYIYWRDFFDKCEWHPYKIEKDITYNANI